MTILSKWIEIKGVRTHYLSGGISGVPVILLHGGVIDSASLSWRPTIEPLASHVHVFALDWPGYGESDKPDIEYTTDYYISFLREFMHRLGIVKASLVGVSMGGCIALGFALQYPQSLKSLVLVDSYGLQNTAPAHKSSYLLIQMPLLNKMNWALMKRFRTMTRASLESIFYNPNVISDELVDEVQAELNKSGAGKALISCQKSEVLWHGLRTVYIDRLQEIKIPTLIVHGEKDRIVPLECACQAHKLIKDSQLHVIADCGHWPQREKYEEFNRVLFPFLVR